MAKAKNKAEVSEKIEEVATPEVAPQPIEKPKAQEKASTEAPKTKFKIVDY